MTAMWVAAILCVGVMGFAIQRGGTCTVAAVNEILTTGQSRRLAAMLEASLWVAGGLALAHVGHLAGNMPTSYAVSGWTVVGGLILGLGAWINRACVIGTVARLGSGEWAYAATPLGFFVGCLSEMTLFARPREAGLQDVSVLLQMPVAAALCFLAFALWRLRPGLLALRSLDRHPRLRQMIWSPHAATVVIGVSFVVTLLLVGRWSYTDVLTDLARSMVGESATLAFQALLFVALFVGAIIGGRTAERRRSVPVTPVAVLRCFIGGMVMGWGSLLVPGSNDGLILIGVPLLRPYAWIAFASMFGAVAVAMRLQQVWTRLRPQV